MLVFLFRGPAGRPEYAVFRRADDSHWQSVSGGVEEGEDLETAARRETAEESGLPANGPLFKLDMVSGVEKECFAASRFWPEDVYIVPKHFFAMDVTQEKAEIVLSREHHDVRWLPYEAAYETLRYDDDKTALWELDQRIRRADLPTAR
ncbi:NUDIX pyrophosphatase [Nonomuraea sp. MG754425]|uniref:NUDIX hydrolase n=1 Tax=Nonomuraea sp. MG754425 TaxID=2570319 RepID=UPI001F26C8B8|nr:NUDIX domain-containing protein [Nonomuraea sp. MG754425]